MKNNIVISKNIIDNYKNNIDILKELSFRIKSGSCSIYDLALYDALVNASKKDKTLHMSMTISA